MIVSVISKPLAEKYLTPNTSGPNDTTAQPQRIFLAITANRLLSVMQYKSSIMKIIQVITAVIKGAKFAYPNGVRSK